MSTLVRLRWSPFSLLTGKTSLPVGFGPREGAPHLVARKNETTDGRSVEVFLRLA